MFLSRKKPFGPFGPSDPKEVAERGTVDCGTTASWQGTRGLKSRLPGPFHAERLMSPSRYRRVAVDPLCNPPPPSPVPTCANFLSDSCLDKKHVACTVHHVVNDFAEAVKNKK